MGISLPEIPDVPQRGAGPTESFGRQLQVPERGGLVHAGTFVIETKGAQPRSRTPGRAETWKLRSDSGYQCFLNCGSKPSRCGTPARDTTHSGTASALSDTWPAADVYEYTRFPSSQPPQENLDHLDFEEGGTVATPSNDEELRAVKFREATSLIQSESEQADPISQHGEEPRAPKEVVDTLVPKTTIEERLKFVDLQYAQEVEKFVEVPEVYYNDIIVEVPQVVEVIKVVPKQEVRENITYVPRFETKYIPKYVEVPIVKIVDRYEEVDEIHEVLKPVPQKSVVDHEDVPVYKRKLEPKIIKEELINQKPHFIEIPVPFEQSV
ncbi:hypothetical protein ACSSS7_000880 [Eimeria intestinalis]